MPRYQYKSPTGEIRIIEAESPEEALRQTRQPPPAVPSPEAPPAEPERPPPQDQLTPPPSGPPGFSELLRQSPTLAMGGGQGTAPMPTPGPMGEAGKLAAGIALPVAGEAIGAGVGAMTGPFAPVAVPFLKAAGAAGGEYLAQKTGISPESNVNLALSAASPIASLALKAAPKVVGRVGPLYEAGQVRKAEEIRGLGETVKRGASKPLYEAAETAIKAGAPPIATARTQALIAQLAEELPKGAQDPALQKIGNMLKTVEDTILQQTPQGTVASLRDLNGQLRDLKHMLKTPEAERLYGAIIGDLDTAAAAGHQGAQLLRAASASWKAERGAARFNRLVSEVITENEGLTRVNADKLVRRIELDTGRGGLHQWLPPAEIERLKAEVARRGGLPKIKFGMGTGVAGAGLSLTGLATSALVGGGSPLRNVAIAAGGYALPVLGRLGKEGIREAAQFAENPRAGQIASVILQGLRVGHGREEAPESE